MLRMYLVYNTVVRLCQFFCCGFLVLRTYSVYNTVVQLCHFFVVAGKLILFEYLTVTIVSQKYRELSL